MKTNFERTSKWLECCGKNPSPENLSVQIGVDLEETAELLRCLRVSKEGWTRLLERLVIDLESLGNELKRQELMAHFPNHLRTEVLDAICDREVTGNGVAYLAGFDKDSADQDVLRSNDSKLEDGKPVILEGGKIGKGKDYKAPDLRGFV
jgi:predicted HAD superfamily Cof-like phosphohydrolase